MSNELIEETINCLRATFKTSDNELRKQAEERLKQLGKITITENSINLIIAEFFLNLLKIIVKLKVNITNIR
jgi:hypothetical protein